mgnify:CR=1 FL=1
MNNQYETYIVWFKQEYEVAGKAAELLNGQTIRQPCSRENITDVIGSRLSDFGYKLHHLAKHCDVCSEGFEGKLRYERLVLTPYTSSMTFFLEFFNDWTGTLYELDLSPFLDDFFGECDPESKLEACLRQHLCLK